MIAKCIFLLLPLSSLAIEGEDMRTILAVKRDVQNYTNSFAIGARTFKELMKNSKIFLDTTYFIKDVIEEEIESLLMLSRRKWGKSINLDMLKTFLEIEVDEEGNEIPRELSSGYRLFKDGEITLDNGTVDFLETPLLIGYEEKTLNEFQGRSPVVFIDYKNVGGADMEELKNSMNEAVARAFEAHKYMIKVLERNVSTTTGKQKTEYEKLLKKFHDVINDKTQRFGFHDINLLLELLHKHFKRQCWVVIDHYDSLLLNIYENDAFTEEDLKYHLTQVESIMGMIFYRNEHVEKGIVAGTFQLQRINENYQWVNFIAYDTLWYSSKFSEFFGYRQSDLPWLLKVHNIDPQLTDKIFKWYAHEPCDFFEAFYSPTTLANFLNQKKFQIYWKPIKDDEIILSKLRTDEDIRKDILFLLSNQTILLPHVDHVLRLSEINYFKNQNEYPRRKILWYLFRVGYLVLLEKKYLRNEIRVPNIESGFQLALWMLSYYHEKYNLLEKHVYDTAIRLANYIETDSSEPTALQNSLENLYKNHPAHQWPKYFETDGPFRSIFECVVMKMQCITMFERRIYYRKIMAADIVIMDAHTKTATFIELAHPNETAHQAITRNLKFHTIFGRFNDIDKIKFVGIEITPSNNINIAIEERKNIIRTEPRKNTTATPRAHIFDEDVYESTHLWQYYNE